MSARHSGWFGKGSQIDRTPNGLETSSEYVQVILKLLLFYLKTLINVQVVQTFIIVYAL